MLLRVAELREDRDGWPAGTSGTIVDAFQDGALFEIADEDGCTLAMLSVPYHGLNLAERPEHLTL